jgi:glycosyltransferase involved in cell wall biosynthesis
MTRMPGHVSCEIASGTPDPQLVDQSKTLPDCGDQSSPPQSRNEPSTKVLIVAYLFPPAGGVGVQRAISFAKHLPDLGCEVFVLTASSPAAPVRDASLLSQIPSRTRIYRAITPEPPYQWRDRVWNWLRASKSPAKEQKSTAGGRSVFKVLKSVAGQVIQRALSPDPQVLWVPFALRKARRIIRKHGINTVLVTVPPFSSLEIGLQLKREFPHLKLISDFRDEWLGHFFGLDSAAHSYKFKLAEKLEREVVLHSDYVVSVTPPWVRQIRDRHPDQPDTKFICVPNGYDPDSFARFKPRPHTLDKIVITYAGTVYDNPVYSPKAYLEALDDLPEEVRSKIETRFIGRISSDAAHLFLSRSASTRQLGFLSQREAFRYMEESDYLLLIFGTPTGHSGKLFEYMATGKPILALSPPDGEIARLIRETRTGCCIAQDDLAAIRSRILEIYQQWLRGRDMTAPPDWSAIREYTRPALASRLTQAVGIGHSAHPVPGTPARITTLAPE